MFDPTFQKTHCEFSLAYVTGNPNLPMTMNLTKSMKDLSICTADTILEHPHHGKLLIRIHQAVHNPSAHVGSWSQLGQLP